MGDRYVERVTLKVEMSDGEVTEMSHRALQPPSDTDGLALAASFWGAVGLLGQVVGNALASEAPAPPPARRPFTHALTLAGNPRVPLCGGKAEDGPGAPRCVGVWLRERAAVDCPDCQRAMTKGLPWGDWKAAVERLLVARHNTTARRYPLVEITRYNEQRWQARWSSGMTPEEAVNHRLRGR